jgi:hypothetical protein
LGVFFLGALEPPEGFGFGLVGAGGVVVLPPAGVAVEACVPVAPVTGVLAGLGSLGLETLGE